MKNPLLIVITAVIVLFVLLAGLDFFILHKFFPGSPAVGQPAPAKAPIEKAAPPQASQPLITQPPKSLEQNISSLKDAITEAAASGENQEVTLVLSETEANSQATQMLAQTEMPEDIPLEINGIHVDFQPGNKVVTQIDTTIQAVFSIPVDIEVTSQVSIDEGKPSVTVTDVSFFGSGLLPQSLKDRITGFITGEIDNLLTRVTEVEVGDGKVVLEYKDIDIQEEIATVTVIAKPEQ